jgi:hypothetical protein
LRLVKTSKHKAFINTRLQPGGETIRRASRFNGLPTRGKTVETVWHSSPAITGLKPGVNEMVLLNHPKFNHHPAAANLQNVAVPYFRPQKMQPEPKPRLHGE